MVERFFFHLKRKRISCQEKLGFCLCRSCTATLLPCNGSFTNCLNAWRGLSLPMPGQDIIPSNQGLMKPGICGRRPTEFANHHSNQGVGVATVNLLTSYITSSEQEWISWTVQMYPAFRILRVGNGTMRCQFGPAGKWRILRCKQQLWPSEHWKHGSLCDSPSNGSIYIAPSHCKSHVLWFMFCLVFQYCRFCFDSLGRECKFVI